ncbi:MAG: [NiFe]-hydrogenase assembly chaperone HybE [Gammaproteobacteria bacterium]|nr:[NiFe]-hydrogenase assembly chaperone HybE [Gammaproteobacteria bacterium]
MSATIEELERHYTAVLSERMRGMPFVNPALEVEAIEFRDFSEHQLGVLLTPWFMNLVLLPGSNEWDDCAPGTVCKWSLPEGTYEFNICRDEDLGIYMTAVLFRSVTDFADQETARSIATEIMQRLFEPGESSSGKRRRFTRRDLFGALGGR